MWYSLKLFLSDKWITVSFILAIISQFFALGHSLYYLRPNSDQIFLHYNVIFGIDYLGSAWKLFMPPLIALGVIVINGAASLSLYQKDKVIARAIGLATAILSVFLFLGIFLIVGLNS